ncbi:MAG: NTP transferase domain-containing protein [Candidatus Paceibacterota bacterium]|jgi:bifunctional UDP-N-acetylglucosamine pyrophosphorylase/glucosamine-1-phosphate N-acetyltransferase
MENSSKTRIVVLAGGKGTRMKSELPKALASLHGKPLVKHLLDSVDQAGIDERPIVVVGYRRDLVMQELGDKYEYAVQEEQLGTGHAVLAAKEACGDAENIIVISGDQPFITPDTIKNLLRKHIESNATLTITTAVLPDFEDWRKGFTMYGRILRQGDKIIDREYRDATEEEKKIKEVNVSCFAFKASWLWENLQKIDREKNVQNEYYLTDLWEETSATNEKIGSIEVNPREALGANSKEELEILEKVGRI